MAIRRPCAGGLNRLLPRRYGRRCLRLDLGGRQQAKPFDGLIFRLKGGNQVFDPQPWESSRFAEDYTILPTINWGSFTDNFIIMFAASDQDWFSDDHWAAITNNARLIARAARLAGCVGVCFDAEPYGTNPWVYSGAAHYETKSFAEYEAIVRQRGAEFIQAIEKELPAPKILTFPALEPMTSINPK